MFAIIDIETTGGKPKHDRITEIAILIHNGERVIESFTSLVNPQRPIDPFVSALTGITDEMVSDAPLFEEIAATIQSFTENRIIVAHNVRFDYGIIKHEFKRLGQYFQRKQLCTVRLSKKIFPDLTSYSLGRLCSQLEIPLDNRHRAAGDAEATAVLFEKLLFNDRKELINSELKEGLKDNLLPPSLDRKQVEKLPDETGIYYFKDRQGKILYIGKSKDIRQRVISHFSSDIDSSRFLDLKDKLFEIDYVVTGNELVAMLLESDEIKRFMPPFNRAQRRKKYRYGLFLRENEHSICYLSVELLKLEEQPVIRCTTKRSAQRILDQLLAKNNLVNPELLIRNFNGDPKKMNGLKTNYNDKLRQAIRRFHYDNPSFFIIDAGISPDEDAVVWVENNVYKGYGYINSNGGVESIDQLKDCIRFFRDNPDVNNIIRRWLRKNKSSTRIIPYETD